MLGFGVKAIDRRSRARALARYRPRIVGSRMASGAPPVTGFSLALPLWSTKNGENGNVSIDRATEEGRFDHSSR